MKYLVLILLVALLLWLAYILFANRRKSSYGERDCGNTSGDSGSYSSSSGSNGCGTNGSGDSGGCGGGDGGGGGD